MSLSLRFILINFFAFIYAAISFFIAQPWINSLAEVLKSFNLSLMIVLFIAIIPGYLNMLLLVSLLVYRYDPVKMKNEEFPAITLIIPAYNEGDVIRDTCRGIRQQNYPNKIEIIFVNDGSTDNTLKELKKLSSTI